MPALGRAVGPSRAGFRWSRGLTGNQSGDAAFRRASMSIPGFGNIMPIHGDVLPLIGWRLSRGGSELIEDESERLEEVRMGHAELVRATGEDSATP